MTMSTLETLETVWKKYLQRTYARALQKQRDSPQAAWQKVMESPCQLPCPGS